MQDCFGKCLCLLFRVMSINPMNIMSLVKQKDMFKTRHPKFVSFVDAGKTIIDEGSIVEITLTDSKGKTIKSNMKVTKEDVEFIKELL